MVILWLSRFLLDAWHVPSRHQSYPLGLNHHVAQHSASTADVAAYLTRVCAIPQVSLFYLALITTIARYYLPVFEPQFGS